MPMHNHSRWVTAASVNPGIVADIAAAPLYPVIR
jgi:hypothetical protein